MRNSWTVMSRGRNRGPKGPSRAVVTRTHSRDFLVPGLGVGLLGCKSGRPDVLEAHSDAVALGQGTSEPLLGGEKGGRQRAGRSPVL